MTRAEQAIHDCLDRQVLRPHNGQRALPTPLLDELVRLAAKAPKAWRDQFAQMCREYGR